MNIVQYYINSNSEELKKARKGGNAKGVAIDFAKFCKKHNQECHVYEGTFKTDKKNANGTKEVTHYWNVLGTGIIDGDEDNTGPGPNEEPRTLPRKYPLLVDLSGKYEFLDTELSEDLFRNRYKVIKEIKL